LKKAYCKLGGMKIKIIKAKHNIFDKLTLALFGGHIRRNIERTVANNIIIMLQPFEKKFNEIFEKESLTAEEGARKERPQCPKKSHQNHIFY